MRFYALQWAPCWQVTPQAIYRQRAVNAAWHGFNLQHQRHPTGPVSVFLELQDGNSVDSWQERWAVEMRLHCARTNETRHPATGARLDVVFLHLSYEAVLKIYSTCDRRRQKTGLTDVVVNSRNSADGNDVDDSQSHLQMSRKRSTHVPYKKDC